MDDFTKSMRAALAAAAIAAADPDLCNVHYSQLDESRAITRFSTCAGLADSARLQPLCLAMLLILLRTITGWATHNP